MNLPLLSEMGRPAINWTFELESAILVRIAHGESVRQIAQDESMPASSSIYEHLIVSPEFAEKYARAREAQMDAMSDEILEIADDGRNDTYETEDGAERINTDVINRSRLRVDTRKWLMSKLAPKKYGDKVEQFISGPNGGPIQAAVTVEFVKPKSI